MARSQQVLDVCELSNLDFNGPRYTWRSNRKDGNFTNERLDRVTANRDSIDKYPNEEKIFLLAISSYHCPLLMRLFRMNVAGRHPQLFRFEASWNLTEYCNRIVERTWNFEQKYTEMIQQVEQSLMECWAQLRNWKVDTGIIVRKAFQENQNS